MHLVGGRGPDGRTVVAALGQETVVGTCDALDSLGYCPAMTRRPPPPRNLPYSSGAVATGTATSSKSNPT